MRVLVLILAFAGLKRLSCKNIKRFSPKSMIELIIVSFINTVYSRFYISLEYLAGKININFGDAPSWVITLLCCCLRSRQTEGCEWII